MQVSAMAAERPGKALGYVVINETAAHRAAGMDSLLRLPLAQVTARYVAAFGPFKALTHCCICYTAMGRSHAGSPPGQCCTGRTAALPVLHCRIQAVSGAALLQLACILARVSELTFDFLRPALPWNIRIGAEGILDVLQVIVMHREMASAAASGAAHTVGEAVHASTANTVTPSCRQFSWSFAGDRDAP